MRTEALITISKAEKGDMRGRRIGEALITAAKQAVKPPISLMTFVPNFDAQAFDRKNGFVETDRTDGDSEEGLPDLCFTWPGTIGRAA
jgi:hypothetical protein